MAKKLTEEQKAANKTAKAAKAAQAAAKVVEKATVEPTVESDIESNSGAIETVVCTVKGTGICKGWINGIPFAVTRGKENAIPKTIYNVLKDSDEIE